MSEDNIHEGDRILDEEMKHQERYKQLIDWPEDNVNYWWFLGLMALSAAIVVCLGYVLWDKFF